MVVAYPQGVLEERARELDWIRESDCRRLWPGRLAVARQLDRSGWDVTVIDEREDALHRLGEHWAGGFIVGHGIDVAVLEEAGIEEAHAVVVADERR